VPLCHHQNFSYTCPYSIFLENNYSSVLLINKWKKNGYFGENNTFYVKTTHPDLIQLLMVSQHGKKNV
jgi:hypothetical protein